MVNTIEIEINCMNTIQELKDILIDKYSFCNEYTKFSTNKYLYLDETKTLSEYNIMKGSIIYGHFNSYSRNEGEEI